MSQTKKIKFLSRKIGKTLSNQGLNIPEVDALLLKNKNDKALIKRCEHRKQSIIKRSTDNQDYLLPLLPIAEKLQPFFHRTKLKPVFEDLFFLKCLQKSAYRIQVEHYSQGILQSRAYRRFLLPISTPFPCRSGRQTYRLSHVIILWYT